MKYVLDTNIVARLLDGDERVLQHLVDVEPSDVGISLLVFAELRATPGWQTRTIDPAVNSPAPLSAFAESS